MLRLHPKGGFEDWYSPFIHKARSNCSAAALELVFL